MVLYHSHKHLNHSRNREVTQNRAIKLSVRILVRYTHIFSCPQHYIQLPCKSSNNCSSLNCLTNGTSNCSDQLLIFEQSTDLTVLIRVEESLSNSF